MTSLITSNSGGGQGRGESLGSGGGRADPAEWTLVGSQKRGKILGPSTSARGSSTWTSCLKNHLVAYHHIMPLDNRVFVTLKGKFLAPASLRPATEEEIAKRADALERKKNST